MIFYVAAAFVPTHQMEDTKAHDEFIEQMLADKASASSTELENEIDALIRMCKASPYKQTHSDINNRWLYACHKSSSLPLIKFYTEKFLNHVGLYIKNHPNLPADWIVDMRNDEIWYYHSPGGYRGGPVLTAVRGKGTLEIVKYLISKGFDYKWGNEDGTTPMRAAVWENKLDVLKFLVEMGTEICWGFDIECSNLYTDAETPEMKKYLKGLGKKDGLTAKDFRAMDEMDEVF